MPRFTKGDLTIETAVPGEAARLRAQGFTEHKAKTAAVREVDAAAREADAEPAKPTPAPAPKPTK